MTAKDIHARLIQSDIHDKSLLVAYSGGVDSHVLLHVLSSYTKHLTAIHVHHGIHKDADGWIKHCEKTCEELDIPLIIEKINLQKSKESLEAQARVARYLAIKRHLDKDTVLLTAHHQDDQAETFLLQLFRGAGVKGLSSMPENKLENKPEKKLNFVRPLLSFTRSDIEAYAKEHALNWIEDDSNQNTQFDRNFMRHHLLPEIKKRWKGITKTLVRTANHASESQSLLDDLAKMDLEKIIDLKDKTLFISKLNQLSLARQRNVIRYWLNDLGFSLPNQAKLVSIQNTILLCKPDANPLVEWKGVQIRRYQDKLYAMRPLRLHNSAQIIEWDLADDLALPADLGIITKKQLIEQGMEFNGVKKLNIRFRQTGERCKIKGQAHSKPLKQLFQMWSVPPWERGRVPLVYHEDKLIAVLGYCVCDD